MGNEPDCEPVYNIKFLKLYPHVLSKEFKYSEKKKKQFIILIIN